MPTGWVGYFPGNVYYAASYGKRAEIEQIRCLTLSSAQNYSRVFLKLKLICYGCRLITQGLIFQLFTLDTMRAD
jgi:hypothetical protein